jgi:hypothetical protein
MTKLSRTQIERALSKHGIDYSAPGFYDTPAFKAVEKEHPTFVMSYAEYVDSLTFPDDYLARARKSATEAAEFMHLALVKDGRRGACIDASGTLQRILEREGIWNYFVVGGLRVEFPASSRIPDIHFWPLVHPDNPAQTGHAWLRVPPFAVIDITLPIQEYSAKVAAYFGNYVITEESVPYEAEAGDLFENELVELLIKKNGHHPTLRNLPPSQIEFMTIFPAFEIQYRQLRLKYIPMRISAMDAGLEGMKNLCLSGKYPLELYKEFQKGKKTAI